jgi:hypothetical protein
MSQHKHKFLVDRLEYTDGDIILVFYACSCGIGQQKHEFIGMVPSDDAETSS